MAGLSDGSKELLSFANIVTGLAVAQTFALLYALTGDGREKILDYRLLIGLGTFFFHIVYIGFFVWARCRIRENDDDCTRDVTVTLFIRGIIVVGITALLVVVLVNAGNQAP